MIVKKHLLSFDNFIFIFAAYLLINGWSKKNDTFLTAESGLGYTLGIVGGSLMLVLMLYPIRKHIKILRKMGRASCREGMGKWRVEVRV